MGFRRRSCDRCRFFQAVFNHLTINAMEQLLKPIHLACAEDERSKTHSGSKNAEKLMSKHTASKQKAESLIKKIVEQI